MSYVPAGRWSAYFPSLPAIAVYCFPDDAGAVCVSRPTNPTGNVLSDEEVAGIAAKAAEFIMLKGRSR